MRRGAGWVCVVALLVAACDRDGGPADLVIRGVTLIDGTGAEPRPGMSVSVRDGRIVRIASDADATGGETLTIDGAGKYLIPGLWDMHVHLGSRAEGSLALFLANGVTTVREMGGDLSRSGWVRQETRHGRLLGPRVLIAGPTLDAPFMLRALVGTPFEEGRAPVADSAAAVAMVDSLAGVGVDHLKVHSMTPRAAYFAILGTAAARDIPVVGHIPDSIAAREAIEAGQRTIEHDYGLSFANSARGEEIRSAMLARIQERMDGMASGRLRIGPLVQARFAYADSARRSYDLAHARSFAGLAARSPVWFTPTLTVMKAILLRNEPEWQNLPELRYVPRSDLVEDGPPVDSDPTPQAVAAARRDWDAVRTGFSALVQAGAKFVTGTDTPVMPLVPGFSLHREIGLLVEAGLTPHEALRAATHHAAEAANLLAESGTVEEGKRADLVLLDADPLASVGNTQRIHAVVAGGRLLDRATLDRMLADAEALARDR